MISLWGFLFLFFPLLFQVYYHTPRALLRRRVERPQASATAGLFFMIGYQKKTRPETRVST